MAELTRYTLLSVNKEQDDFTLVLLKVDGGLVTLDIPTGCVSLMVSEDLNKLPGKSVCIRFDSDYGYILITILSQYGKLVIPTSRFPHRTEKQSSPNLSEPLECFVCGIAEGPLINPCWFHIVHHDCIIKMITSGLSRPENCHLCGREYDFYLPLVQDIPPPTEGIRPEGGPPPSGIRSKGGPSLPEGEPSPMVILPIGEPPLVEVITSHPFGETVIDIPNEINCPKTSDVLGKILDWVSVAIPAGVWIFFMIFPMDLQTDLITKPYYFCGVDMKYTQEPCDSGIYVISHGTLNFVRVSFYGGLAFLLLFTMLIISIIKVRRKWRVSRDELMVGFMGCIIWAIINHLVGKLVFYMIQVYSVPFFSMVNHFVGLYWVALAFLVLWGGCAPMCDG